MICLISAAKFQALQKQIMFLHVRNAIHTLGLYIQKNNNCQLTMDIDDYELGFVKSREQEEFGKYSQISYALEFCKRLDESPVSAFWTHFATKHISQIM